MDPEVKVQELVAGFRELAAYANASYGNCRRVKDAMSAVRWWDEYGWLEVALDPIYDSSAGRYMDFMEWDLGAKRVAVEQDPAKDYT